MFLAPSAHASAPAGVWGLVEEVQFTPKDNPSTMRIDGLFMIANQQPDFPDQPGYSVPQYGYINYACLAKQLPACAMEWNELLAIAGTADNCRGWGDSSFEINGTVRPADEPMVEEQEVYPVSMGILIGASPCQALAAFQAENPEPASSTGEGGTTGANTTGVDRTAAPPTTSETGTPPTTGASSSDSPEPVTGATPTEASTSAPGSTSSASSETTVGNNIPPDKAGCACNGTNNTQPPLVLLTLLALSTRRRSRRGHPTPR